MNNNKKMELMLAIQDGIKAMESYKAKLTEFCEIVDTLENKYEGFDAQKALNELLKEHVFSPEEEKPETKKGPKPDAPKKNPQELLRENLENLDSKKKLKKKLKKDAGISV